MGGHFCLCNCSSSIRVLTDYLFFINVQMLRIVSYLDFFCWGSTVREINLCSNFFKKFFSAFKELESTSSEGALGEHLVCSISHMSEHRATSASQHKRFWRTAPWEAGVQIGPAPFGFCRGHAKSRLVFPMLDGASAYWSVYSLVHSTFKVDLRV